MELLYKFIGASGIVFAAVTYRWMPWWGTSASVALGGLGFYLARDERGSRAGGSSEWGWDWSDLDLFDWFSSDSSDSSDSFDSGDSGDSGDFGGSDD